MWWITLAFGGPALEPGAAEADPPTVTNLGVRWAIGGDDDHDAVVTVRYQEAGAGAWRDGLPLYRVRPEDVVGWPASDEFAGSVFDLLPGTAYTIELTAVDPDGGGTVVTVDSTTREMPADPQNPRPVAVASAAELQRALRDAAPGDVITLADGVYDGPFEVDADGSRTDPIVIRGATRDGTILDGGGCPDCNVVEIYGSYVHLERLTIRNANRALRFQGRGAVGNAVRYVHAVEVGLGFGANEDQQDFTLCDNELEGPLQWPHVYTDDNGQFANVDGILVMGTGHVICHNHLKGWGDAMKMGQPGGRSVDFVENDVEEAYDNGVELDEGEGNVRAIRNRFTNTYATISFQPIRGGPAYAIRNLVVNVANEQLKFHSLGGNEETSGIFVLHNTFVSPSRALHLADNTTSHHFRVLGNLFVGPDDADRVVEWGGGIDDGLFDGDGWWPDGRFDFGDAGDWQSFAAMQGAGPFEAGGLLLDGPPFASGLVAPTDYRGALDRQDPTLRADSVAVDAAAPLPGITDASQGAGPDLGAQETGCPVPAYGPRPEGVNEDVGCAVSTPPGTTPGTTPTDTGVPAGDDDDDDPPADGEPQTDGESGGKCGCASGPGGPGIELWVAGLLLLARRLRTRAHPHPSPLPRRERG